MNYNIDIVESLRPIDFRKYVSRFGTSDGPDLVLLAECGE